MSGDQIKAVEKLDGKGRHCGRKPIRYERGMLGYPYFYCDRCNRRFDTGGREIVKLAPGAKR
jgi:hypothetical protein